MKKLIIFFSLIAITFHALAQDETKAVKESFEKYKKAIIANDAVTAMGMVDNNTIQYYTGIVEKAKTLDSTHVDQLPLMDKMMVLLMRYRLSKQQLLSMDGKGMLTYAIEKGMIGKAGVANLSIGAININGDNAKGKVVVRGQETPANFEFNKDAGLWKIDLTSLLPMSSDAMKQLMTQTGRSENEFLLFIIGLTGGSETPGTWLWQPIIK